MIQAPFEFDVYIKDGCGLCDSLLDDFEQFSLEHPEIQIALNINDILDDEQQFERFKELIPLVFYQQQEVCRYFFDPQAVLHVIKQATAPH